MKEAVLSAYLSKHQLATPLTILLTTYALMYFVRLPGLSAYVIPSTLWILTFLACIPNVRRGVFTGQYLTSTVIVILLLRVGIEGTVGVFEGYGLSPYGWSFIGRAVIVYYALTRVLAYEASRVILLQNLTLKRKVLMLTLVIPFSYTGLDINPHELLSYTDVIAFIKYLNSEIIPTLGYNLLQTQIAYLGGLKYSLLNSGAYTLYSRLTPILPNLSWASRGILGVVIPLIGVLLLYATPITKVYSRMFFQKPTSITIEKPLYKKLFLPAFTAFILLLPSGLLGFKPLIIVSSSMKPTLEIGDIVFIVETRDYKVGDIIAFNVKDKVIVHRIVSYDTSNNYVTKGDANREVDPWTINDKSVVGEVTFKIPRIGLIILYVNEVLKPLTKLFRASVG